MRGGFLDTFQRSPFYRVLVVLAAGGLVASVILHRWGIVGAMALLFAGTGLNNWVRGYHRRYLERRRRELG